MVGPLTLLQCWDTLKPSVVGGLRSLLRLTSFSFTTPSLTMSRLWFFFKEVTKGKKDGDAEAEWWLRSIISRAYSSDRGNSEALSLCRSIPPFWEDSQNNTLSLHLSMPSLHSLLLFICIHLSFDFSYVFSDNCFSLQIILEVKSVSDDQIVVKKKKKEAISPHSPCKTETKPLLTACDKSKKHRISEWVLPVEERGCVCYLDGGVRPVPESRDWLSGL